MARYIGMPAARAFSTEGATADNPVFVINRMHLSEWRYEASRARINLNKYQMFEDKEVIGLSSDEVRELLPAIGAMITKRYASNTPHVEWLWLKASPNLAPGVLEMVAADPLAVAWPVEIDEWNGNRRESFLYIASHLLGSVLKRDMTLSTPHGEAHRYSPEGNFQIYIWSSPEEGQGRFIHPPAFLWDIPVSCRDRAFQPTAAKHQRLQPEQEQLCGMPLSDGEYIVAELFPNALYIHHDVVDYGSDDELRLFAEIMKRAARCIADPEEWARYLEEVRKQEEVARKKALTVLINRSVTRRAGRTAAAFKEARALAERLRSEYFAAERMAFGLQDGAGDIERSRRNFASEFEKLRSGNVGYVETIKFDANRPHELHVFTKEITVINPHTHKHHLLGRFEIVFNLDRGGIRIVNLDRTFCCEGRICHSPHVFSKDGSQVCQGNIESELQAYIAHFEIEAATALTVSFLQSVKDEASYLERLALFPVVKEASQP